ncbi:hypothetical protein A2U01_0061501, partial [Trifolium medium]|nr:hypothetical protein [Trifolium medium]
MLRIGRGREDVGGIWERFVVVDNRPFVVRMSEFGLVLYKAFVVWGVGLISGVYFYSKSLANERALDME